MAFGPGKYDLEATELRERLDAAGIILIVWEGERGSGFSAQLPAALTLRVPELLEDMAKQIRRDLGRAS